MKKYILLFTLLLSVISAYSQYGVGEWIGYNPYYKAELVEDTGDKVYFVSLGSLYSFDKDDNSIENYNKVGGLSDTEVSMIHYSTKTKQLVVIYKNSNIDLVKDNRLYNISDIYDKSLVGDKSIISYSENSGTLFLATSFGIVVVDLNKREISDSYNWGETVYAVGYNNGKLYASLRSGITVGNISDNLSDRSTWTTLTNSFYGVAMYSLNNKLHCLKSNGELVYLNEENNSWTRILSNSSLKRVKNWGDDSFAVIANDAKPFYIVDKDAKFQTITCPNNYTDISCNNNKGIFWSADANTDLTSFKLDGTTPVLQQSNIKSSGIGTTAPFHMAFCNNQLYVAGGGKALDRKGYRGVVSTFKDNAWYNVDADSTQAVTGQRFRDVVHVTPDPLDPDRVFAFTWGEGMYEFKNNKVVNLFNQTNSPILSIASSSLNYHRIDGGAFDKDHNLWFTASEMEKPLIVYKNDGTWASLDYAPLQYHYSLGKVFFTSTGYAIVTIDNPKGATGLFVLNYNGTVDNTSDDTYVFWQTLRYSDGGSYSETTPNNFNTVVEDRNGSLWIGTTNGPFVVNNHKRLLDLSSTAFTRIKIPRNDGTDLADYLLENENIVAIAVDGANRKWIGTEANGVYLISEDGLESLHHFTQSNSPLPSDNILSLVTDNNSGIVYMGTDKGLIGYQSDAIEGKESYSDVYAYPNPVRPDYSGVITITGLMENSLVKITDINNNLIYQANSLGGQICWDGLNVNGDRVATGVYLVYSSTEDGKEGCVTKILFVK